MKRLSKQKKKKNRADKRFVEVEAANKEQMKAAYEDNRQQVA